jgi:hypothetical protein
MAYWNMIQIRNLQIQHAGWLYNLDRSLMIHTHHMIQAR